MIAEFSDPLETMTDETLPTRGAMAGKGRRSRGRPTNLGTRRPTVPSTEMPPDSNINSPQSKTGKTSRSGRPLNPNSKFSEASYDLGTPNEAAPDQAVPGNLEAAIGASLQIGATKRFQQQQKKQVRGGKPRSQPRKGPNLGIKKNVQ